MTQFPYSHSWIGFERLFDELEKTMNRSAKMTYPPYNLKKMNDNTFVIEIACAGFSKDEIDVVLQENILTVTGRKNNTESSTFIYKGLAERNFERKFTLASDVQVKNVSLVNGLLTIILERVVPEEKKPKKLEINSEPQLLLG